MFFKKKKKKGMIDVGEMYKKGKVHNPNSDIKEINSDKEGFVDISSNDFERKTKSVKDCSDILKDSYSKKEVDNKIQELDKVIYKLEQRIEFLEKKAGINNSNDFISW